MCDYVDALNHNYVNPISNGNGTHTKICANDNGHTIIEECYDNGSNACVECGFRITKATEGLTYELKTNALNGTKYAVCTGIGTATDTDIVIGSHYEGFVVEQVSASAFKGNTKIKSVKFVNGMEKLNMYAFQGCTSLMSVHLSETVNNIGQGVFQWCENLLNICNDSQINVKMGSSSNGYVGNYACNIYSSKSGGKGEFLTEGDYEYFIFPDNKFAMKYNGNETVINLPNDVTGLYKDLYKGKTNLKEVYIPSSVKNIGKMAFDGCTSLEKVTIAENSKLVDIGESAFLACKNLKTFNFNSTLEDYLNIDFAGDTANPVYFTKTLNIGNSSVYDLTIPEGVTKINAYSFVNAESIKNIQFPASLEEIGASAFSNCFGLQTIKFANGSKLKIINVSAFEYCKALVELNFPKSLEIIDDTAFRYCDSLTTIKFENDSQLTSIGQMAFIESKSLKTVHLGHNSSIKTIGKESFRDCAKMTEFNMGNNCKIETIEGFAFYQCRKLKEFYIPSTCTYVGNYTFGGCFDGLRNDPKTPYLKIYLDFDIKPASWSDTFNSSNCPIFVKTKYPTYPV